MLAAKVDGAALLDELTGDDPLDHFVLYASIASLFGARGQANHAAANAYLDALAHARVAAGRPGMSIDWGAWSEVGAAADRGVDRLVAERGIGVIPPADGLAVLDALLARPSPQVGVSPVQWPVFLQGFGAAGPPAFYAELARQGVARAVADVAAPATVDLAARLADAAPDRRRDLVLAFVRDRSALVLSIPAGQLGDGVPLSELGLDSLMAVELRNLLGAGLGTSQPIPATLVFDYPTVEAIAGYLATEVLGLDAVREPGGADGAAGAPPAVAAPVDRRLAGSLVSSLLDDLENLSDDEIEAQLARRGAS